MKRDFAIAAKAVIIRGDQILILHRSKEEMQSSRVNRVDAWDLPGGGIQFFETVEEGLHREIMEEASIKAKIIKPIGIYDAIRPQLHITIITYVCEYCSGEVTLSSEHDAYYWICLEEMEQHKIPKALQRYCYLAVEEYKK